MIRKLSFTFLFSLLGIVSAFAQEAYFQQDPTLSPNGKTIVFSYDGDLWKMSADGGQALRITAMEGNETLPRISPDGKWLAFTSTQYGNKDVYLMPMEGGEITQLTYHDMSDEVEAWSWDSQYIYFTSGRNNRYNAYKVSIEGSTPQQLFDHYFINAHNIALHPTTGEIFFNESWESKAFATRKRYKGDYNPDIKSYNLSDKSYKEYTSYRGKDMQATIDAKGNIYFVSDEQNDEYNLYTFVNGKKTALTDFDSSIRRPQVSADGSKIVFVKDYQLYIYDVASKQAQKVDVTLTTNNTLDKLQDFNTDGKITFFDVSPDNKKMAFVSRGELFVSDIKGEYVKQLSTTTDERVREVKWLKDNRTLLFTQTSGGYTNLFTIKADGSGDEKRITEEAQNQVNLSFDSKRKKAVYQSGRNELRVLDLKSMKSTKIVSDEFWALQRGSVHFSPDDQYIVYNAYRNFEDDIFVYHFPTKRITNLTESGVSEKHPVWSPDGKYIYFESNLTQPTFPRGDVSNHVYRIALDKFENAFKSDKFDDLFDKKKDKNDKVKVVINAKNIMERIEKISPNLGLQGGTEVLSDGNTSYVYYASNHDEGNYNLWRTVIKPFEKNKTEKVDNSNVYGFQSVSVDGKHYMRYNGKIHIVNLGANKNKALNIDTKFQKNLNNEFQQMFYEAWAGFESNFYDNDFHGQNWQSLRDEYAQYLPYVTKRSQLKTLFNDMLGELNTSHVGLNTKGSEEKGFHSSKTLETGIVFSQDKPYIVEGIITRGPADITDKNIKSGDRLVSVNGQKVDEKKNREFYFSKVSLDKEITLEFKRGRKTIKVNLHPTSSRATRTMLYDEWVDDNQAYVDKMGNNRIAYVHMKNMSGGQLYNFKREMVSEAYNRDALILDLRYNTGGNVHNDVLQFLSQKPYANWKYRDGKLTSQPNFTPGAKPIIVLINEQSLSDSEMMSAGFKALGLGTIVGTETYRWIIFTSGAGLVDGSSYRLPSWGCYTLDGDNLELTGVAPDIYVKETFEDKLKGNQPQLNKAIELILKDIK